LRKALEWCDVANMLRVQMRRMDVNYFPSTRVCAAIWLINIIRFLNKEIVIMHPGPINRGVELRLKWQIHQSVILNQVENG
jgi:aspartate carbamoyltransferase catalytic subunit